MYRGLKTYMKREEDRFPCLPMKMSSPTTYFSLKNLLGLSSSVPNNNNNLQPVTSFNLRIEYSISKLNPIKANQKNDSLNIHIEYSNSKLNPIKANRKTHQNLTPLI